MKILLILFAAILVSVQAGFADVESVPAEQATHTESQKTAVFDASRFDGPDVLAEDFPPAVWGETNWGECLWQ